MRKFFLVALSVASLLKLNQAAAQNSSPFWSLAGNSNASTTSKLGTTNSVSLRFYAGNVQRMLIGYNSGNVSIGATSLDARLTVNAAAGSNILLGQINGTNKLRAASNGGLSVGSGATPPTNGLYVLGRVGLGTTAPSTKLHIVGTGPYVTALQLTNGGIRVDNDWSTGDTSVGIYGEAGTGVFGKGMTGVQGDGMTGVYGSGYSGVTGQNWDGSSGYGVSGYSSEGTGVYGNSTSGVGVWGTSNSNYAGQFISDNFRGIYVQSGSGWYAGYFAGDVFTTGAYYPSDARLKKNVSEFSDALSIINKLQPKHYEYRNDGKYAKLNLPQGTHYGLIAQDVEKVLPQLVKDASTNTRYMEGGKKVDVSKEARQQGNKPAGEEIELKGINYSELLPIVIRGMQEQQAENKALKAEVAELRQMVLELKQGTTGALNSISGYLEQNTPNPVNSTATIRYHVPESATSARLVLTNTKGQVLRTENIRTKGPGQININTSMLAAGTYGYTLYVDGKQLDSKRLIVAR